MTVMHSDADLAGGAVVATVDVGDLARLAQHAGAAVRVASIQPGPSR